VASLPDHLDRRDNVDLPASATDLVVRRVVLVLLLGVLVAALVGVFGQQPATSSAGAPTARLRLSSPDAVRGGLIFQAKFEIEARQELKKAALVLDQGWFEGMTLNSVEPEPIGWAQRDGRNVLELGHIPRGGRYVLRLQFQVNPTAVGGRTQNVRLEDGGRSIAFVRHSATVFP
jgi:hypothetical protein